MDWRTREMEARQRGVEAARRLEPGTVPEGDEARAELANERLLEDLKDVLVGLDGDPEARYVLFQDLATTYVAAFQDEAELVSASHAIERLARDNPDWAIEPTAGTLDLIERVERLAGEGAAEAVEQVATARTVVMHALGFQQVSCDDPAGEGQA